MSGLILITDVKTVGTDARPETASLRTLGSGSQQAAQQSIPVDGPATTPSLRTLGPGAQEAAPGNHTHTTPSGSGIGVRAAWTPAPLAANTALDLLPATASYYFNDGIPLASDGSGWLPNPGQYLVSLSVRVNQTIDVWSALYFAVETPDGQSHCDGILLIPPATVLTTNGGSAVAETVVRVPTGAVPADGNSLRAHILARGATVTLEEVDLVIQYLGPATAH